MALNDQQFDHLVILWSKIAHGSANPDEVMQASRLEQKINAPSVAEPVIETFQVDRRVRSGYILSNGDKRWGFLPEHEMKYLAHLGLDFRNMEGAKIELAVEEDLGRFWKLSRLPIALSTAQDYVGSKIDATVFMITDRHIWFSLGLAFQGQFSRKLTATDYELGDSCKVLITKFVRKRTAYVVRVVT